MATSLMEFKEYLNNALRYMMGLLGYPVQDQNLDSIFMGPFLNILLFCSTTIKLEFMDTL